MKVGVDSLILGSWIQSDNPRTILDIGTGTGLLALMMAQRFSAQIHAIEIDEQAARQASENCNRSNWADRIKVEHISLQEFTSSNNKQYELIISNPPYFTHLLKSNNEARNRARHNDFLTSNTLLNSVSILLAEEGRFALILPENEARRFEIKANIFGLYCERKLNVKPKATKGVHRMVMEFVRQKIRCSEETICIRDVDGYSSAYRNLTKSFYLNL